MLETITTPILLKAVDFIFGEASNILKERRKHQSVQKEVETDSSGTELSRTTDKLSETAVIQSKEDALNTVVLERTWLASEAKVKHLLALLETYAKNYYIAKEKYVRFGRDYVPPIVIHQMAEAEDGIAVTGKELEDILSKVYGKKVSAPGLKQT